jgi:iron complex transport system ATP-binding protein
MNAFATRGMTVRRGPCPVVEDATLAVGPGEFLGLVGPNGAGKTTLLRAAVGLLPADGERPLAALPPAARARAVAWLPQAREIAWPVPVADLVALGRLPYGAADPADPAVIAALDRTDARALAGRPATALSGGEQARVLIARAVAQGAPVLVADEPVAGLDPAHQIGAMQLFAELAAEGRAVVVSLHDLGLAARFCTRIAVMHRGRIVADGPPRAVLTPALLAEVFGIRAHLAETADGPVVQPVALVEGGP